MTFTSQGGLQSLSRLVLGQNVVSYGSNLVPRQLDVTRFGKSRTDGQPQEVRVTHLGWHEMDHTVAVDASEENLVPLIGSL
jgi:hypothetical protein